MGVFQAGISRVRVRVIGASATYGLKVGLDEKLCCRREAAQCFVSVVSFSSTIPPMQSFLLVTSA